MITGAANRWSTGMSKNPWICALCRSIVSTRLVPAALEHVRHQLGRNRHARLVLAILPRVAVIRHHRRDARRRRAAERIDHDHQLHQVLIDRPWRRAGRLHDEDVGAADVLVDLERDLRVGKPPQPRLPERHAREIARSRAPARGCALPEKTFSSPNPVAINGFTHVIPERQPDARRESWLGRKDSNLRIRDPKSRALPLGHAPLNQSRADSGLRIPDSG